MTNRLVPWVLSESIPILTGISALTGYGYRKYPTFSIRGRDGMHISVPTLMLSQQTTNLWAGSICNLDRYMSKLFMGRSWTDPHTSAISSGLVYWVIYDRLIRDIFKTAPLSLLIGGTWPRSHTFWHSQQHATTTLTEWRTRKDRYKADTIP